MISQVKEEKIKYSIVVAVYNRPEEMAELLESISLQDFKDFEIVVVDDGSEKSSREISFKYAKKMKISYHFTENLISWKRFTLSLNHIICPFGTLIHILPF